VSKPSDVLPPSHALDALDRLFASALDKPKTQITGVVTEVTPAYCRVSGLSPFVKLGECIELATGKRLQLGEVVRIDENGVTVKPFDTAAKIGLGTTARRRGFLTISPHPSWKGRIVNALGAPIDDGPALLQGERAVLSDREPPPAMRRQRARTPLRTGVRVIDFFTPLCAGQRIGIFAGSGIGKSTLLAMLARSRGFDTAVLALVGERGREVRDFLEDALKQDKTHAVTVVATGDESPMMRRMAPKTAMCIAEYFRDLGEKVLLVVDSVTRFAHAARDVALAAGEPPVARGYTPSVFSELPKFLERAGPGAEGAGSITGVFSVLVDGDDHNDPVADNIRGTLDGHIVLDRAIADQGRFPAVNMLTSVSRLATAGCTPEQWSVVTRLRAMIARYEDTRDLRLIGGYRQGSDPDLDKAVHLVPKIYDVMRQRPEDPSSVDVFQEVAEALAAEQGGEPPASQRASPPGAMINGLSR
jgi:flagellum-specific ATP synthase